MEKKAKSFFLEEPDQTYGIKVDDNLEFDKIPYCDLLGQKSIPFLGIYGTYYSFFSWWCLNAGYDYQWLYPTAIFRREFSSEEEFAMLRKELPQNI